jgi:acyl-CoA oxidase
MSANGQRADGDHASVDAEQLRGFVDGQWGYARDEVREVLSDDPLFHPAYGLGVEEYRDRVWEQLGALAKTRGPKLLFPEEYGGEGIVGAAITAFEMLGMSDLSLLTKAGVQWGLFGGSVHHLGTERHHRQYLQELVELDLIGCFAMTETGHGSDVQSVRTTATYDPGTDEWVIDTPDEDARKDYIGNAARDATMATVFAQLHTLGEGRGVHAFLVPIRDEDGDPLPGVTIEDCGHKAGLNGVDNGRLWFDQVRIPRDNLLDRYGQVFEGGRYYSDIENETKRFFTTVGTLVQGRISVSGAAVSATKVALAIAVKYGMARRQFSAPDSDEEIRILDFRAHQRKLIPAVARTYAMHFAQEALIEKLHVSMTQEDFPERERRKLESLAAGTKATTTWHATRTIQTCREACGGAGYLSVNRLPQLKADTDVFTTFEGDNTVLLQLVAKGLLTDYRDEFQSLDTLGMARFVADQVIETVVERTAARRVIQNLIDAVPGREEDTDLYDRGWHLDLFEWREKHVIDGVAQRIKNGIDDGGDPFEVFNDCQDHVLLAAQCHIDRIHLEEFVAAIDRCEDPAVKAMLNRLCDMHALSHIEEHRAWFMEHGRLSTTRSKLVIKAVNELCDDLRPHIETLVDAWGVPDELIAAPIALGAEERRQRAKAEQDREDALVSGPPSA